MPEGMAANTAGVSTDGADGSARHNAVNCTALARDAMREVSLRNAGAASSDLLPSVAC